VVRSCTIITTRANEIVQPVHERMPVMLSGDALWAWLEDAPPAELISLLQPYPAGDMVVHPVSAQVNRSGIDTPELVIPTAA
jgi:putative SOS response-associated peptidase YedK